MPVYPVPAKLAEEHYQNVLREDLAGTLRDNAACKLKVFETLSTKIRTSVPEEERVLNIAGRWRDNWGIIYTSAGRKCLPLLGVWPFVPRQLFPVLWPRHH
jgi:hypothetical protein